MLYKGDCLEIMPILESKSIDMILCDLPYGTTACKWDVAIPFKDLWAEYDRIIKENGAIVLFGSDPFSTKLKNSNLKNYRYEWVWQKEQGVNFLMAKKQPLRCHEIISVFYKKQPTYNPQFEKGQPYITKRKCQTVEIYNQKTAPITKNSGYRYPKSVIKFNRERGLHPTQKPVALLEYLIKTYTNENELVLDNCMGSGSTGIACLNTGRRFIGIEKDEKYFNIASERIHKHREGMILNENCH